MKATIICIILLFSFFQNPLEHPSNYKTNKHYKTEATYQKGVKVINSKSYKMMNDSVANFVEIFSKKHSTKQKSGDNYKMPFNK
ncbi:MAG: hypothetical protein V4683_07530 [Bacteroidota bacterium]